MVILIVGITGAGKTTYIRSQPTPSTHLHSEMFDSDPSLDSYIGKIDYFHQRTKLFITTCQFYSLQKGVKTPIFIEATPRTAKKMIEIGIMPNQIIILDVCPTLAYQRAEIRRKQTGQDYIGKRQIETQKKTLDRLYSYIAKELSYYYEQKENTSNTDGRIFRVFTRKSESRPWEGSERPI